MSGFEHMLPDKKALKKFIADAPTPVTMRDIAKHFSLKGQARTGVRRMLKELVTDGTLVKNKNKTYAPPDRLPETALIEITDLDIDGELHAKPAQYHGRGRMPKIYVVSVGRFGDELKKGDQALAKLKYINKKEYEARILKTRDVDDKTHVIGIFKSYKTGGYVYPTDKRIKEDLFIDAKDIGKAQDGDLVKAEYIRGGGKHPRHKKPGKVIDCLGRKDDPKLISLIAIHSHGIPVDFPKAVLKEADTMDVPKPGSKRKDIRDIPLVTIDGEDARDFDDAVFAAPDKNNPGGWKMIVAIADVSYYVRAHSALDNEAVKRGNSTYFADRVVPMLPEKLSNDLCSLKPDVDRACLFVEMWIDKTGRLKKYIFARGLMRSSARLTYEQVEDAHRGNTDKTTAPLMNDVIKPLYEAYSILKHARSMRGALEIDLPERKALINKQGEVTAIIPRKRLESHQLIEEFMILANVAAASALEDKNAPCLYRIHPPPHAEKIEATRDFLKNTGYSLPRTDHISPANINHILNLSAKTPEKDLVHTVLLRLQSQATYDPENIGHFGLALEKYAHFTSPIRRYADLIVHRSLVQSHHMGPGGLPDKQAEKIKQTAEHISDTERNSMLAERDVMDRFTAQYLSNQIGKTFAGKISGVTSFGLFITLDDSGADGLVPIRTLPNDYYIHDEKHHKLVGKNKGRSYQLADAVIVRLIEADPMRGSTILELIDGEDRENDSPKKQKHKRPGRASKNKKKNKKQRKR